MKLIIQLAIRNLLRQKRRNLLLSIIIAFAMAVLIMASSLGRGMTDIIVNKYLANYTGHIMIENQERSENVKSVIRDKALFKEMIATNTSGILSIREKIVCFSRAIGNKKSASVFINGTEISHDFLATISLGEGKLEDFTSTNFENPVLLNKKYAKKLNLRLHDTFKVRLTTINNQSQTARFLVAGILKNSDNIFMDDAVYIKDGDLKRLLDYREQETDRLLITLVNPDNTEKVFENLYKAFQPDLVYYKGMAMSGKKSSDSVFMVFRTNKEAIAALSNYFSLTEDTCKRIVKTNQVLLSKTLSDKLGLSAGSAFQTAFRARFGERSFTNIYRLCGTIPLGENIPGNLILINENDYYHSIMENLPEKVKGGFVPFSKDLESSETFVKEWELFPKCRNEGDIEKAMDDISIHNVKGTFVKITTMFSEGSEMYQYSILTNYITFFGVLILFFITQIGVVNTLRMSVRERTREIGTIRAIGMQKGNVSQLFILETLFLTLFASLGGIVLAYIAMGILSSFNFDVTNGAQALFIVDRHIHFVASIPMLFIYTGILLVIGFISAYFPAKKASKQTVSGALRHYE